MTGSERWDGTEDRQIVVHRVIAGPRRLVFKAWTEAKHLEAWWGPHGFSTTTNSFDFRPGGIWDFQMHGPDGTTYPNWVRWREIVEPERIVYVQGSSADDPNAFVSSITFVERAGGTEVTLRTLFNSKAQRDDVVERYGALEGARQTLERLSEYLVTLASAGARV